MSPLVSICVVTYNSARYVLETLESAKVQMYDNIELVISDDCSSDDTIDICKKWIDKNYTRFKRVKLITSDINTGISANCNRAFRASIGEWIKLIAGDDILLKNCVYENVIFVQKNNIADIVISKNISFNEVKEWCSKYSGKEYFSLKWRDRFLKIIQENFISAPTSFIRKSCYLELGGFEETIPYIEDWPFWVKAIFEKKEIKFLDKYTVKYRLSDTSISQREDSIYSDIFKDNLLLANTFVDDYAHRFSVLLSTYRNYRYLLTKRQGISRLFIVFILLFNPYTYYYKCINIKLILYRIFSTFSFNQKLNTGIRMDS